jgi:hypothetical protein
MKYLYLLLPILGFALNVEAATSEKDGITALSPSQHTTTNQGSRPSISTHLVVAEEGTIPVAAGGAGAVVLILDEATYFAAPYISPVPPVVEAVIDKAADNHDTQRHSK